jgi:uncharacterized protein with GYD domain
MSRFIVLINYAGDEVAQVRQLPALLAAARQRADELGITIEAFNLTFGRFDAVAMIDAPDEPTAATFILTAFGTGPVRTETMSAVSEDQLRSISDGLLD